MEKSCHNCADYIVCYGMNEIKVDKGANCQDWHLDFIAYQELTNIKPKEEGR